MKVGNRVKVIKDIPSINGMLRKGTMVRIDHISSKSNKLIPGLITFANSA